jgi:hypothetical protein
MFRHGPSCLEGPISRTLANWSEMTLPPSETEPPAALSSSFDPSLQGSQIRAELVERIRRAIAEGRYETPEKWQAALELLLRRLQDS